ncbi:MAG: hypothetical protein AAGC56_00475 [Pseudomonadota bacterium]
MKKRRPATPKALRRSAATTLAAFSAACGTSGSDATTARADDRGAPAVLTAADATSLALIKATLAAALGRATIDLGPGDLTTTSVVAVRPPRPTAPEDRSVATPTVFDLRLIDGDCVLVARSGAAAYPVEGLDCRPAD